MAVSFSAPLAPASSDLKDLTTLEIQQLGGIPQALAWAAANGYAKIGTPDGQTYSVAGMAGNPVFDAALKQYGVGDPIPTTLYDTPTLPGAAVNPSGLLDIFKKQVGPFPVWAWALIAAGGLFLVFEIAKPSKASSSAPKRVKGRFQPKAA